jgi:predicted ArsR family transcriptional regulator
MLDLVRRAESGMTVADVVAETGLHPNTVRAHLEQLVDSGLVTRHRRSDGAPGRPAWHYHAGERPAGELGSGSRAYRPYRELAGALVEQLARDTDDPHAAGARAGRGWGRLLAASLPRSGPHGHSNTPVDGLIQVLDGLGFSPHVAERPAVDAATIHLRSCPFLDLALANPDVMCGVHLGVIGGALGALGAAAAEADLEPFAVPGACVVRVRARRSATASGGDHETADDHKALDDDRAEPNAAIAGKGRRP